MSEHAFNPMTPEQFMSEVIGLYRKAKMPLFRSKRIQRGRKRIISGGTEDLLAAFLDSHLENCDKILVDQPISFPSSKEKTNYLDIALLKGTKLVQAVDVKIDLGHQRKKEDAIRFYDDKSSFVKRIRGKEGWISNGQRINVSRTCFYHLVVISGRNITDGDLRQWLEIGGARKYTPYVATYVLSGRSSDSLHPNKLVAARSNDVRRLDIRSDAFSKLLTHLKKRKKVRR